MDRNSRRTKSASRLFLLLRIQLVQRVPRQAHHPHPADEAPEPAPVFPKPHPSTATQPTHWRTRHHRSTRPRQTDPAPPRPPRPESPTPPRDRPTQPESVAAPLNLSTEKIDRATDPGSTTPSDSGSGAPVRPVHRTPTPPPTPKPSPSNSPPSVPAPRSSPRLPGSLATFGPSSPQREHPRAKLRRRAHAERPHPGPVLPQNAEHRLRRCARHRRRYPLQQQRRRLRRRLGQWLGR